MEKLSYEKPNLIRLNEIATGQTRPTIPPAITPPPLQPLSSCAGGSSPTGANALAACTTGTTAGTTCSQGYGIS